MGLQVDLIHMIGAPPKVTCPKCNKEVATRFSDFDIECGDPNPLPGVWKLHVYCTNCEHEFFYEMVVQPLSTEDTRFSDTATELRIRLRRTVKLHEGHSFFHENTAKDNQFISAVFMPDEEALDVTISLDKLPDELKKKD